MIHPVRAVDCNEFVTKEVDATRVWSGRAADRYQLKQVEAVWDGIMNIEQGIMDFEVQKTGRPRSLETSSFEIPCSRFDIQIPDSGSHSLS